MKVLSPKEVYDHLDKYVEGQEHAKRILSNAYFLHSVRSKVSDMYMGTDEKKLKKTDVLLTGSTGCGKTFLIETLSELTGLPILKINAKSLSNTGYVGTDINKFIQMYLEEYRSNKDTVYGICFIDEVDKLCIEHSNSQWNKSLQHTLLKFVEGCDYKVPSQSGMFSGGKQITFNSSHMLVVFAGSFSHYYDELAKEKDPIGFNSEMLKEQKIEDAPHVHLVKAGMVRELAGRISRVSRLNDLTKDMLLKILTEKDHNIYEQYRKVFKFIGVDFTLTDEQLDRIATKTISSKTGARGLQTYLEEEIEDLIFELDLDPEEVDFNCEKEAKDMLCIEDDNEEA